MNEQHVEDMITVLYDMIQDAKSVPLSSEKCIIERNKALDMLDEILAQLPVELKQSRTIVESRNELIGQARREAENVIRQAEEKAAELVVQEAIFQEAKRQCQEMILKTQDQMAAIRRASNEYMDSALQRTEEAITQALGEVQDTRSKFAALAEAQERKAAAPQIDTEI